MTFRQQLFRYVLALAGPCLALLLFPFSSPAQAHTMAGSAPSFQVQAGFGNQYRDGNWIPVQVTLRNTGPDFSGTLSLSVVAPPYLSPGNFVSASSYQAPISLANGALKQITLSLPVYYDAQGVTVKLLDSNGNAVVTRTAQLSPVPTGNVFIGVLTDATTGFGSLNTAPLPGKGSSVALAFLNANSMPTTAALLKNFDALVLDNFTTGTLNAAQLGALQTWVRQGGTIIAVGGPEWSRTLAPLPAGLVPVTVSGTAALPAGSALLPPGAPGTGAAGQGSIPDHVQAPVTISTTSAIAQGASILQAYKTTPLLAQARYEQGTVIYLAFDPTLEPLLSWQGASVLWKGLLLRSLGERILPRSSGTASYNLPEQPLLAFRMSTLLQSQLPNALPSPWWILGLLLAGYLLILGPLRFLVMVRLKRRDWNWRIVLSAIVVFSLLTYAVAYRQKSNTVVSNSFSVAQYGLRGAPASITTYQGIFVPNQGAFQIHVPGNELVQLSPDSLPSQQGEIASPTEASPTGIVMTPGGADLTLQDVNIWTLHALLEQQNRQLPGALTSQLTLNNGILSGTVTNTLGYALSDAFLLLPANAVKLGYMAAGESKRIHLKVSTVALPANATLSDLIALNTNSPTFEELPVTQFKTAWQRHLSMLYALDGEGFYAGISSSIDQCQLPVPILPAPLCFGPAPLSNNGSTSNTPNIVVSPGWPSLTNRSSDPLLVPGALATLIGWTNNTFDTGSATTVNGINPTGLHETLVQAPLSISMSGPLSFPPGFITGQLVDTEGGNAQSVFSGVYTISTGSMTFEYTLPTIPMQLSGLSITGRGDINLYVQAASNVDVSALPFTLYNWHTRAWDAFSLSPDTATFSTGDIQSYIGPGGHVLVQLKNTDSSFGTFAFAMPSLNLQGTTSGGTLI